MSIDTKVPYQVEVKPTEGTVTPLPHPHSTNDVLATFPEEPRQYSAHVRGMLLYLPRTGMIVVPTQIRDGGWGCIVVHGTETYPRGGYDIYVSDREVETAHRVITMVNGRTDTREAEGR